MTVIYFLGPSHLHPLNYDNQISDELLNKTLFNNCHLDGNIGIPNWSKHIYYKIYKNIVKNNNVCWMVSDYKFNNFDYNELIELDANELFLNNI